MYYRAGRVSTCGSRIRRDFVPDHTATALERLDAAGALDLGGLNMAEFAVGPTGHNIHWGHCRNPWNPDYVTGGSSSGAGSAVAGRLVFGALGSDTGGSVRLPASMCGLVGIKPTQTRVSRYGTMGLSFSLDNVGPLARTVRDAARLLRVVAGHDPHDPTGSRVPVPAIAETDIGDGPEMGRVIGSLTHCTRTIYYLGLPSVSVPAGFQPIGRPFAEARLLRVAAAYEAAAGWVTREPALAA